MNRHLIGTIAFAFILGLNVPVVSAFYCPHLVKECEDLVGKLQKRQGTDTAKLAQAKAGCEEALKLHKAGKHKDSVIKVGEAISAAGEAAK